MTRKNGQIVHPIGGERRDERGGVSLFKLAARITFIRVHENLAQHPISTKSIIILQLFTKYITFVIYLYVFNPPGRKGTWD